MTSMAEETLALGSVLIQLRDKISKDSYSSGLCEVERSVGLNSLLNSDDIERYFQYRCFIHEGVIRRKGKQTSKKRRIEYEEE
jgi:hypothetical protein